MFLFFFLPEGSYNYWNLWIMAELALQKGVWSHQEHFGRGFITIQIFPIMRGVCLFLQSMLSSAFTWPDSSGGGLLGVCVMVAIKKAYIRPAPLKVPLRFPPIMHSRLHEWWTGGRSFLKGLQIYHIFCMRLTSFHSKWAWGSPLWWKWTAFPRE